MILAAIPSPTSAVWHLGPFPVRAYALCIVAGIVVACAVTEQRLRRHGVAPWAVLDVAVWAVPFGVVGARIYHVLTSWGDYFGFNGEPVKALYIWEGGLGIWGAVAGGAVGALLGCRQLGLPLRVFADALAPGLPLAQAVGRLGNWFNNELYGGPTTLPWGLEVHVMDRVNPGRALAGPDGEPMLLPGLYHPTFLYEALWNVGVALLVLWAARRFRLGHGRAFALYVAGYTLGRFWIEIMRSDPAPHLWGVRFNVWMSVAVLLGAVAYLVAVRGGAEYVLPRSAEEGGGYAVVDEAAFAAAQAGPAPADPADRAGAATDVPGDAGSGGAGAAGPGSGGDSGAAAGQEAQDGTDQGR